MIFVLSLTCGIRAHIFRMEVKIALSYRQAYAVES